MRYSCVLFQKEIYILVLHALVCVVHFDLIRAAGSPNHHHHRRRVSLPLIHRDSIRSPYYNPNDTIADRARYAMQSSHARFTYLMKKKKKIDVNRGGGGGGGRSSSLGPIAGNDDSSLRNPLVPSSTSDAFLVNISIGNPPRPQLVIMDTGSDLTWVKCRACSPEKCPDTFFNYSSSSTFKSESCSSQFCEAFSGACVEGSCEFNTSYEDGSGSHGFLAQETFTSLTSLYATVALPDVVFGCAETFTVIGIRNSLVKSNGIMGLGPTTFSIANQMVGQNFSYCVGNISDLTYNHNQLVLGGATPLLGDSTPMDIDQGDYEVSLESIIIGETRIPVPTGDSSSKFNTMIDSGSTHTYLVESIFTPLKAEVERLLGRRKYIKFTNDPNMVCFKGQSIELLRWFPVVTLEFAEGAELNLDVQSFFYRVNEDVICTSVTMADDGQNLIGLLSQQFYNVAYDLSNNRVYFERIDCELLSD